ncbi:uncharacterized protein LOC122626438 [Drosophila teissieri]|uniref:uncharacterized protein LOC122626438 n=1 Tax=Drosophila teissieri TaxID=7243 RepID=UPI001CBA20AF|nr:uncharacterized protein LOC122626438 [Drosophila teissieri]
MYHSLGPRGAYFMRPCPRDRLSSSASADKGYRFKRIRYGSTCEAERRAAKAALDANVPPARLYLRSTSRGLRRALHIYMPRFQPDEHLACSEEEEQRSESLDRFNDHSMVAPPAVTNRE